MKHISEILPKALEELLPKTKEVKETLEMQKRFVIDNIYKSKE